MANLMPWQLCSGKELRKPLTRKLDGPQRCFGEENNLLSNWDLSPENVAEKFEIIKDGCPCFLYLT
jgi:hypothetical protein